MRYRVVPARSQLWARARSSLHDIRVQTSGLEGIVEVDVDGDTPRLEPGTRVEIETSRLRSGNALIDVELARRLEVRKFPQVVGEVREVKKLGGTRFRLIGDLSFHGVTKTLEVDVEVRAVDDEDIEIEGETTIDMRDFGLNPPKILLLRVHPQVDVRARVFAER